MQSKLTIRRTQINKEMSDWIGRIAAINAVNAHPEREKHTPFNTRLLSEYNRVKMLETTNLENNLSG